LRLRHLPIFNRPVYLYLHTKRYRCLNCEDHPTTTQRGD
jgi:transposase